jgi:hypothetical protein
MSFAAKKNRQVESTNSSGLKPVATTGPKRDQTFFKIDSYFASYSYFIGKYIF